MRRRFDRSGMKNTLFVLREFAKLKMLFERGISRAER